MDHKKVSRFVGVFALASFMILVPAKSFASLDINLSYGARGSKVIELQEFLIDKGFLQGQSTGNFFSLTLKAVKAFQGANRISATGYVGALTRTEINNELALETSSSTAEQLMETGTTTVAITPNPKLAALQQQIALLQQQLQAQQNATSVPTPAVPTPPAPSSDYSTYAPVTFPQYQNNSPSYIGQNIVLTGMNDSFIPSRGKIGSTNFVEVENPFDPAQPKIELEVDDSASYTALVNALQDKSQPIHLFLRAYGIGVPTQQFTSGNIFGLATLQLPVIRVSRVDQCIHGSMNTTILSGSGFENNFSCTAWSTVVPIAIAGNVSTVSAPPVVPPTPAPVPAVYSLALNPNYGNTTAANNTAGVKIGSFILNASQDVTLGSLNVGINVTPITGLSSLRVMVNSKSFGRPVQPYASNYFNDPNDNFPAGQVTIDVYADASFDKNSLPQPGSIVALGAIVNGNVQLGPVQGQVITFTSQPTPSITPPPVVLGSDATLKSLTVNGTAVAGFSPNTYSYAVTLPAGSAQAPAVTAALNDPAATDSIVQAANSLGTARVAVMAQNGKIQNTYTLSFKPSDAGQCNFNGNVFTCSSNSGISISPTALPNATIGTAYSQPLAVSDPDTSSPNFRWNIISGVFPPGMGLAFSSNQAIECSGTYCFFTTAPSGLSVPANSPGVFFGTPTAAGTYSFTFQAIDSQNYTALPAFSLTVASSTSSQ